MKYPAVLLLLVILASISSCIPTKKLTYLQENTEKANDSIISLHLQQQPYRVQVSDVLSIRLKALDQELVEFFNPIGSGSTSLDEGYYYDGFAVDRHGNIRMPTLGEINVLGRTTEEIRGIIEQRLLKDYFERESDLFVTVKLAGIRYTMVGEISSPGIKTELTEKLSVMQAIANSGDIPITGDRTDVIIIRQYPGGQKVHHIDLTTIDAMNSPYYYVQPNDMIVVNPLPQKSFGSGTTGLDTFRTILTVVTALTTTILLFTRL
ncbi:polysaccharide biosynthesis/export family protein [uncultured Dokdonia sp.]|uniref:polysaccharide biosynthesis/export family protein n=1 Tax=uncultured Dokdonia sp. TaxID=575653 RepID=UPI0026263C48|nr:polysaccharide biosynthesis/export family protein [uncultured Dokdonia sp.]